MQLQARECQGLTAATSREERGMGRILPPPPDRTNPAHTCLQTSGLQDRVGMDFCCLRPPRLWQFVMAGLGHKYTARGLVPTRQAWESGVTKIPSCVTVPWSCPFSGSACSAVYQALETPMSLQLRHSTTPKKKQEPGKQGYVGIFKFIPTCCVCFFLKISSG